MCLENKVLNRMLWSTKTMGLLRNEILLNVYVIEFWRQLMQDETGTTRNAN